MTAELCEKCGLPHERIVGGQGEVLCPDEDRDTYNKARESWDSYKKLLTQRRRREGGETPRNTRKTR